MDKRELGPRTACTYIHVEEVAIRNPHEPRSTERDFFKLILRCVHKNPSISTTPKVFILDRGSFIFRSFLLGSSSDKHRGTDPLGPVRSFVFKRSCTRVPSTKWKERKSMNGPPFFDPDDHSKDTDLPEQSPIFVTVLSLKIQRNAGSH